jgi:hypothetical protein
MDECTQLMVHHLSENLGRRSQVQDNELADIIYLRDDWFSELVYKKATAFDGLGQTHLGE